MLGTKISSTSRANSEFHGDRFAQGREERSVGLLGWDLQDGLFMVVEAEVEGHVVQNYYPSFSWGG